MPADVPVIAVDGPGGSGKGTVCAAVASRLGWRLLDSGALYRLVALAALERDVDLDDTAALADLAGGLQMEFRPGAGGGQQAWLGDRDVTARIRDEDCSQGASRVAAIPAVRKALVARQRAFRRPPGLVADGRDMGSVIFPDARLQVFLTASVEERARRRHKQLNEKGIGVSLSALSKDMSERDRRDAERSVSPLVAAPGARILDTTDMTVDEVVARVVRWAREVYPQALG